MSQQADREHRLWVQSAVRRHEAALCRYAARILGDDDRARDVVQETFLRLCKQTQAELDGHLAEWLFTVCRNQALDACRKERRMTTLTETTTDLLAGGDRPPDAAAEANESAGRAARLMITLPPRQQEALRLKFQGGLSYREIAAVTGSTVSAVGVLIHEGVKTLRKRMT